MRCLPRLALPWLLVVQIALIGHAQTNPVLTNVKVLPSPSADIQAIDPSQPDFGKYVSGIVPEVDGRDAIARALPYAIVLRNLSTRKIWWVTVRYAYAGIDGRSHTIIVSRDCRASAGQMASGVVALIIPDGAFTQAVAAHGTSSLASSATYSERMGRIEELAKSADVVESLDSAVYDNGEFIGPDLSARFSDMHTTAAGYLELVNGVRALADAPDVAILTLLDRFANEKVDGTGGAAQARTISARKVRAALLRTLLEKRGRKSMDVELERLATEARAQVVWRAEPVQ